MSEVALWGRDRAPGFPGEEAGAERIAVTYSTTTIPPRSELLPLAWYREATPEELKANPRLRFYPKNKAAENAELGAIGAALEEIQRARPPTLEVP